MTDLLVRGGTLIDGTGAPPQRADVLIEAGRVRAVGLLPEASAARVLDAAGAMVLPGFVDVHTHYDLCLEWPGLGAHCLRQGITAVVGGNCGLGEGDVGAVLARAARAALPVHFGVLAPLGPLRSAVVPRREGRAANALERPRVADAVARALDQGALGVSWGPYHANSLMDPDELAAALAPAAARRKPFCVHRRSEGAAGLSATQEAVGLARATGVRLHVSHLKAAGRFSWAQLEPVLECLEAARQDLDVAVDVYPYDASLTYLSAIIPDALKGDGALLERLATAEGQAAARAGIEQWFAERQGPDDVVLLEPPRPEVPRGATLAQAATLLGAADPTEAALQLLRADPAGTGGWAVYRQMMAPAQVEAILELPYAAVASDAVPLEGEEGLSAHPRAYATFARALARALPRGPEALAAAVHRMTRLPAERMNLDRGRLVPGAPADLVLVRGLEDLATYEHAERYPAGIEAVVVDGVLAFEGGEVATDARGTVLRT